LIDPAVPNHFNPFDKRLNSGQLFGTDRLGRKRDQINLVALAQLPELMIAAHLIAF
jgi:hypothetical protein